MSGRVRSLRRRLFRSHLQVMGVALVVLVVGMGVVLGLLGLAGEKVKGGPEDGGPLGLLVGLAAAATASALVSRRVSRRLAAPLEAVGAATRQLATGRYDVRVPGSDVDELDNLASDVNTLAAELQSTEERRLRLIGDVAHELRNPLSTIEGTMEALLDGVVAADDDTYARIGREAARLRRLADDLSSLSAAGELGQLATAPVDLGPIVADVVGRLEPQANAKGLELRYSAAPNLVVDGDADRLVQVLTNVIGNSVQYTVEGRIDVAAQQRGSEVVVEVVDTGVGLAAADQTRIFERFHRVDQHFADGSGVGLAIAKLIVDAHGGTIAAHSDGLGRGTTVAIALPVADQPGLAIGGLG